MISVLLVDDDPALLDLTRIFLGKAGPFTIDTTSSGVQALAKLSSHQYDVIISDYEMPGIDGIQLLKTLKLKGDQTPFIIFTGKGLEQVVIDALNNGASYYFRKGCDTESVFAELADKCQRAAKQRRSQRALKESEEKYRALVEHAPDGILILDVQGTILLANDSAAKAVEADSPSSLAGRNVTDFIAPGSKKAVLEDFAEITRRHDSRISECEAVALTGNSIRIESIGKAIHYESGPAILFSFRVVPRQKLSEQDFFQNSMLCRTILTTADYGAFILQEERIKYANPFLTRMTGYTPDLLLDMAAWDLIEPGIHQKVKGMVSEVQRTGKNSADLTEVTIIAKGGHEYHVRLGMYPVLFEEKPAILGIALDITAQRSTEIRLEQLNKKMHLINEITHHDLLNNFTALFGYFEIIRQNTVDLDNLAFMKKQELILSAIREQISFTGYYHHVGNQKPQWQYGENAIRESAAILPLDGVKLVLDLGYTQIFADPLLNRVFYNLMENSLRHGRDVTEIRCHCEKHPDGLLIVYEDNGVGIPPKDKVRIFSKGIGKNSGLGLFLIKEILAITRITIRENGEPGEGARFELLVPDGMFRQPDLPGGINSST